MDVVANLMAGIAGRDRPEIRAFPAQSQNNLGFAGAQVDFYRLKLELSKTFISMDKQLAVVSILAPSHYLACISIKSMTHGIMRFVLKNPKLA